MRFAAPNFIFATQNSKHSKRPVRAVTPSTALNLPLNDGFADTDAEIAEMTNAILNDFAFAGKITRSAQHHASPAVAALGVAEHKVGQQSFQIVSGESRFKESLVDGSARMYIRRFRE